MRLNNSVNVPYDDHTAERHKRSRLTLSTFFLRFEATLDSGHWSEVETWMGFTFTPINKKKPKENNNNSQLDSASAL